MNSGLCRLRISSLRNLAGVALDDLARVNLFFGDNGAGKSSLLEAVHLLLSGRSFRHHQTRPLIQEGSESCAVFGEYRDGSNLLHRCGVQKFRDGRTLARRDGQPLRSLAELAHSLPVVALHADSFELVMGGPAQRRQFLDWQLFHVEQGFMPVWRAAQRALAQRNALIRRGKIGPSLAPWSHEYARLGEQIDSWRRQQVGLLCNLLPPVMAALFAGEPPAVAIDYRRGWPADALLKDLLFDHVDREEKSGQTLFGPHRAELKLSIEGRPAAEVLSRGQTKLLVAALRLSQVQLLRDSGRHCVVLIDDLGAELDRRHRDRLWEFLESLQQQLFVTVIEPLELLADANGRSDGLIKVFHVEQGAVGAVSAMEPGLLNDAVAG
jgi:DNA replication and repair protein RecF